MIVICRILSRSLFRFRVESWAQTLSSKLWDLSQICATNDLDGRQPVRSKSDSFKVMCRFVLCSVLKRHVEVRCKKLDSFINFSRHFLHCFAVIKSVHCKYGKNQASTAFCVAHLAVYSPSISHVFIMTIVWNKLNLA